MAKILTTAIVADIRNKLNGSVFSKNRYGAYVRTKVTPVNPQTTDQQNARNTLSSISSSWRSLTQGQRDAWSAAAAQFPFTDIYGNAKILSGSALYTKLNINALTYGGGGIADAPSPVAVQTPGVISVTAAAGTPAMSIVFANTPVDADTAFVIRATPQVGAGITFVKNKYRNLHTLAAAGASPYNALAVYNAKFGTLVAGNKIFVQIFAVNIVTGQAGIPVSAYCIVAA